MATFHGDLGRQSRGGAMECHNRALKEVERAFAGRAEQEVVAALGQAICSSGLEPDSTAFVSALAASQRERSNRRSLKAEVFKPVIRAP
jgi:hypothetical protein